MPRFTFSRLGCIYIYIYVSIRYTIYIYSCAEIVKSRRFNYRIIVMYILYSRAIVMRFDSLVYIHKNRISHYGYITDFAIKIRSRFSGFRRDDPGKIEPLQLYSHSLPHHRDAILSLCSIKDELYTFTRLRARARALLPQAIPNNFTKLETRN